MASSERDRALVAGRRGDIDRVDSGAPREAWGRPVEMLAHDSTLFLQEGA